MSRRRQCSICGSDLGNPCLECHELLLSAPLLPHQDFINEVPPVLVELHAALIYEGVGRLLVSRLKHESARSSVSWLSEAMAQRAWHIKTPIDVVSWAPTLRSHRQKRGFDHSRLLAVGVARRLGVAWHPLLRRHGSTSQTGLSGRERRQLVEQAHRTFSLAGRARGLNVLLIDDVATTTSTLQAAASVLQSGGASSVIGLVGAITPKAKQL
ncbi:MAG: hypothetical protein WC184_08125 [Acidimicrobiia bacterium]